MPNPYGRAPSMPFPPQYQQQPQFGYVGQPVPGNWMSAPAPQPRMPVNAAMAAVAPSQPAAPRPTIRLQAPETLLPKPVAPLSLPSPEALGIQASKAAPAATIDWNIVHARLQRLGALGIHMDRLPQGVRVTLHLPAGQQQTQHIEAVADSEAAAVHAAVENAEAWARG